MSGPHFDDLVGPGLEGSERERLEKVHELLIAAGPPPDIAADTPAPTVDAPVVDLTSRRRRPALVAIAAALALFVFALGYVAADDSGPGVDRVVEMSGTASAPEASARIDVFELDAAGNWPMEVSVDGLGPAGGGRLYQLWLTRGGDLVALCGSFLAEPDGSTVVPMNAPWRLDRFDGWVVVEEGSEMPVLTT